MNENISPIQKEIHEIRTRAGEANSEPLTRLRFFGEPDIKDIREISAFTALQYLEFCACPVDDISPVMRLINLHTLKFIQNRIICISPETFRGLVNLKSLYLDKNIIEDITFLNQPPLKNLEYLSITKNNIVDIKSIKNLTKLRNLNISFNCITNIDALQHLALLENLNIAMNRVTNIEALRNLKNIRKFEFSQNQVVSIEPLSQLEKILYLKGENNKLEGKIVENIFKCDQLCFFGYDNNKLEKKEIANLKIWFRCDKLHEKKRITAAILLLSQQSNEGLYKIPTEIHMELKEFLLPRSRN